MTERRLLPEKIAADETADAQQKIDQLPDTREEELRYKQYHQLLLDLKTGNRSLLDISESEEALLDEIAHSPTKTAYKAQALLHVATGRHFPVDMPELPDGTAWQTSFKTQTGLNGPPLKVTPNPATNGYIELNHSLEMGQLGVFELYDYTGRLQASERISGKGSSPMSVAHLPEGMYLYTLTVDGKTMYSDKLVIVK